MFSYPFRPVERLSLPGACLLLFAWGLGDRIRKSSGSEKLENGVDSKPRVEREDKITTVFEHLLKRLGKRLSAPDQCVI